MGGSTEHSISVKKNVKLSNLYVIGILEEENENAVEQMCINIMLKNFQTQ